MTEPQMRRLPGSHQVEVLAEFWGGPKHGCRVWVPAVHDEHSRPTRPERIVLPGGGRYSPLRVTPDGAWAYGWRADAEEVGP